MSCKVRIYFRINYFSKFIKTYGNTTHTFSNFKIFSENILLIFLRLKVADHFHQSLSVFI